MEPQDGKDSQFPFEPPISSEPAPAPKQKRQRRRPEPASPTKRKLARNEKMLDFAIGFIGWWVVNGIFWVWARGGVADTGGTLTFDGETEFLFALYGCILLPLNVLVLVILAFLRRWVALGIVATYIVNFAMALILGTITNGYCWIPFNTPVK